MFDSGIGGLSVAKAIEKELPEFEVLFRHDTKEHFPYATKSPDDIFGYVVPIIEDLLHNGAEVIVIACNTVSTTLITRLRDMFDVPFVALEPMVKPAALHTKSKVITVCATPTTLSSARYQWLKDTYAQEIEIIEPDCSDWSYLIEHNKMNEDRIKEDIEPSLLAGSDVIVLGCTHYHWIEEEVRRIVGDKAIVLQPEQAVITQLKRVIAQLA